MGTSLTPAALDASLARLVAAGTITAAQALAVRGAVTPERVAGAALAVEGTAGAAPADRGRTPWTAILAEVGAYVGAAFVFGAAAVLAGSAWDGMARVEQLLFFAVPALVALAAAGLVAASVPGPWSPRSVVPGSGPRRRLVATLIVLAAGMTAGFAGVAVVPFSALAVALSALAVLVLGYGACRSALLQLAAAVTAWMTVYAVQDAADLGSDATAGLVVGLGALWAALALAGVLVERQLGLVLAAGLAFVGGESLALGDVASSESGLPVAAGYAVVLLVAAGALAGYVRLRYVGLLAAGTLALAVVVPQLVLDVTDGALGAAGALLVCGLSIVAASALGLRLKSVAPAV